LTTPISKKDIEEIKIPIYNMEKQKMIGKLYIELLERQKKYREMLFIEKDIIEEIIFGKENG